MRRAPYLLTVGLSGALAAAACSSNEPVKVTLDVTVQPGPPIENRFEPAAVWTGDHVLFWGGSLELTDDDAHANDGALYDPETEIWSPMAPSPFSKLERQAMAWNGDEAIIIAGAPMPDATGIARSAAAYNPATDMWRDLPVPPAAFGWQPGTDPSTVAPMSVQDGPPASGPNGRVFIPIVGSLLSYHPDDTEWLDIKPRPDAGDTTGEAWLVTEASPPVFAPPNTIYQGLANRDLGRHGLAMIDASTGDVISVETLAFPGGVVGPGHPIIDGDEVLLLGVESIGDQPRKAVVLAPSEPDNEDTWEVVARADDEDFIGMMTSGYHALVVGNDAIYSLDFNQKAGVFQPSTRSFGVLDLEPDHRCALGRGTVWTGEELVAWNGQFCGTGERLPPDAPAIVAVRPHSS